MAHKATTQDPAVLQAVRFCTGRALGGHFTMTASLPEAIRIVTMKGPDRHWGVVNARDDPADHVATGEVPGAALDRRVLELTVTQETRRPAPWYLRHAAVSLAHFARFSQSARTAHELGLGWLIPAHSEVLLVPRPTLRVAEGQPGVLHDDAGRRAVEWPDGSGLFVLYGTLFPAPLYQRVIRRAMTLSEIGALPNADQRSVALTYLPFGQLVGPAGAELIDLGVRGTRLYRLPLPRTIARDRPAGYGRFDYFIHMRDASHPEREFIEWVDPAVGRRGDAELCQAHAFGITLEQWLSVEQEG